MKIGYFSSKYPYTVSRQEYICGGSVFATQSLVNEIAKKNHEVHVFTSSKDSLDYLETEKNVDIHRYGTSTNLMSSNISIGLFHKPLNYSVDLVHVSFDIPPGPLAGLRYAKKKGLPLIVTYHGDWDATYGSFLRKLGVSINNKIIVDDLLSYADVIISPSELYVNNSKYLIKYKDKVRVIPNGIDLKEFKVDYSQDYARKKLDLPLNKKILLFFGYLSPYKSPDILLRSFAEVSKNDPDTVLLFAGSGDMEEKLQILSKELKVEKEVIFAGFVEKELRALYYKSADIFCLPSTMSTECYPLAILESMASNTPVVASKIGGIPEIIDDGVTGMLVQPNNQNELTQTLLNLLNNHSLRERLSKNAYDNIQQYSWENIADETNEIYLEFGD